ncbi:MAG: NUDIX domain-containing protein [Candidatus Paceibacterota bacterium]
MEKTKVCLIIGNGKGEMLLQLRDEAPQIGKWVLFGGGVKCGETAGQALAREIKEELGYEIKEADFFGDYEDNGIKQIIYVLRESVEAADLALHEGAAMRFFAPADIDGLTVGFNFKQIIDDYFNRKQLKIA